MFYSERHGEYFRQINPKKESVFDYVTPIKATDGKVLGYSVNENIAYWSKRYKKWVTIKKGDKSDGATNARDIDSFCWLIHDDLCNFGVFEDGSKCSNLQASTILYDIMMEEGYWYIAWAWWTGTFLIGGGEARKNGLWSSKD